MSELRNLMMAAANRGGGDRVVNMYETEIELTEDKLDFNVDWNLPRVPFVVCLFNEDGSVFASSAWEQMFINFGFAYSQFSDGQTVTFGGVNNHAYASIVNIPTTTGMRFYRYLSTRPFLAGKYKLIAIY